MTNSADLDAKNNNNKNPLPLSKTFPKRIPRTL